jgi:transcriptional regulator GlxA family with amidase domain
VSRVVFVLAPGVHLLDLAGPAQVFFSDILGYELHWVADNAEVTTAQGLPVRTSVTWPSLAVDDLVVVPGWRSPSLAATFALGRGTLDRIRTHHDDGGMVVSVCAGADALGKAGLLDGHRCTTHHDLQDELAQRYPKATVIRDVLYVVDGRVATSAGIASGIDLALHLVSTRHGPAVAAQVARDMVVYARRNGDEHQASAMLRHRSHVDDTVHRVQDFIDAQFATPLRLATLADAAGVSARTVTRLFGRATGLTPLRYQHLLRVERAEHLIGHGATVESAARAVGFEDARMLRRLRAR